MTKVHHHVESIFQSIATAVRDATHDTAHTLIGMFKFGFRAQALQAQREFLPAAVRPAVADVHVYLEASFFSPNDLAYSMPKKRDSHLFGRHAELFLPFLFGAPAFAVCQVWSPHPRKPSWDRQTPPSLQGCASGTHGRVTVEYLNESPSFSSSQSKQVWLRPLLYCLRSRLAPI